MLHIRYSLYLIIQTKVKEWKWSYLVDDHSSIYDNTCRKEIMLLNNPIRNNESLKKTRKLWFCQTNLSSLECVHDRKDNDSAFSISMCISHANFIYCVKYKIKTNVQFTWFSDWKRVGRQDRETWNTLFL